MLECERCGKKTKVTFLWHKQLDTVGWYYPENLCEKCYFSELGMYTPINNISELPKLSGVYND